MAKKDEKTVVVVQRGCTCCGTGCVLLGLVIPGATFALWSVAGAVVAISVMTTAMLARGTQVAVSRRRAASRALDPPSHSPTACRTTIDVDLHARGATGSD